MAILGAVRGDLRLAEREGRGVEASMLAHQLESEVMRLTLAFEQYARTGEREELEEVGRLRARARIARDSLRLMTAVPGVIDELERYERLLPERVALYDSLLALAGGPAARIRPILQRRVALDDRARDLVEHIVDEEFRALTDVRRERAAFRGQAVRVMLAIFALNAALVVWLLWSLVRGALTRRLSQLTSMARQVAAGDFSKRSFIEGDDEVAVLAEALNDMAGQLAAFDKVKEEFVALASHQLRTPATAVKGNLGMLLEGYAGELTPEQQEILDDAYQSNERQFAIINDILWVARIEAGRLELAMSEDDLSKIVADVVRDFVLSARERRQSVEYRPPECAVRMKGDVPKLRMVLENLLSNASKYTPSGGRITVTLRAEPGQKRAVLSVADTGVGIAKDDLSRLFVKFSRVPNPLSDEVGGSGLGLYLAREIVTLHEGMIDVESAPGEGTTFTVTLPTE